MLFIVDVRVLSPNQSAVHASNAPQRYRELSHAEILAALAPVYEVEQEHRRRPIFGPSTPPLHRYNGYDGLDVGLGERQCIDPHRLACTTTDMAH